MMKGLMKNFSGTQTAVWLVLPFNILLIGALFFLATFTTKEVQDYFIKVFISWLSISTPTVLGLYGYKRHQERKYGKKKIEAGDGFKMGSGPGSGHGADHSKPGDPSGPSASPNPGRDPEA